jgi:hypothetical protein
MAFSFQKHLIEIFSMYKGNAKHPSDKSQGQVTESTTSFLSLPCEIRQKILSQSYPITYSNYVRIPELPNNLKGIALIDHLTKRGMALGRRRILLTHDQSKGTEWLRSVMSVHPCVAQDMEYVHGKWMKDLNHGVVEWEEMERYCRRMSGHGEKLYWTW